MLAHLYDTTVAGHKEARIVLLTPGPYNETYFEHSYLVKYLGFTLAEGDFAFKSFNGCPRDFCHVFSETNIARRPLAWCCRN